MHQLINTLLNIGEVELSGNATKLQTVGKIRNHEMQINAIMAAIKPGLFNIFLKRFEKHMIKSYLLKVKSSNYEHQRLKNSSAGISQVGV